MPTCGNKHNEVRRNLISGKGRKWNWWKPREHLKKENKSEKKLTLCLNRSWTSIDFSFWIVSWMPKQKSNAMCNIEEIDCVSWCCQWRECFDQKSAFSALPWSPALLIFGISSEFFLHIYPRPPCTKKSNKKQHVYKGMLTVRVLGQFSRSKPSFQGPAAMWNRKIIYPDISTPK